MPRITIDLIRRKAEHNEGLIHTLEELSLHQEELESIDDILGCNCRRLKILYLQNNIIGEMKNLHHMKELEYLNLALNNISKVEGLQSCEFLNKLDLTVNFVDLDELESSVDAMEGNLHLRDLYMMGNPCQSWEGFEAYVIARLPQLERLDGKEVTRTDRIKAQQSLPALRMEIGPLAQEVRQRKQDEKNATAATHEARNKMSTTALGRQGKDEDMDGGGSGGGGGDNRASAPGKTDGDGQEGGNGGGGGGGGGDVDSCGSGSSVGVVCGGSGGGGSDGVGVGVGGEGKSEEGGGGGGREEELTKHTPEVRTAIYREMAEQKKEKEDRQRENLPKERDFKLEQTSEAVARAREREAEGIIRQCNEGKLAFRFEETLSSASSQGPGEEGNRRGGGGGGGGGWGRGRGGGDIVLEVSIPRYLDSSLIDLDVHPHYVSIVIKGKARKSKEALLGVCRGEEDGGGAGARKEERGEGRRWGVLRLSLQTEVRASEAKARRSKTTGSLVVTMPKVDPDQSLGLLPVAAGPRRAPKLSADRAAAAKSAKGNDVGRSTRKVSRAPTLAALMMEEAKAAAAAAAKKGGGDASSSPPEVENPQQAVSIRGMVGPRHGGLSVERAAPKLSEVATKKRTVSANASRSPDGDAASAVNGATSPSTLTPAPTPIGTPPLQTRGQNHASSEAGGVDSHKKNDNENTNMTEVVATHTPPAPLSGDSLFSSVGGVGGTEVGAGKGTGVVWSPGLQVGEGEGRKPEKEGEKEEKRGGALGLGWSRLDELD
eukprot:jgi/Undpi1/13466/HiC_scaffold_8.g03125.m1